MAYEFRPASAGAPSALADLVAERCALRGSARWEEADAVLRRLEAGGVLVDDKAHTWSLSASAQAPAPASAPAAPAAPEVPCGMCGKPFPSRNAVFRHLRDPASGCGSSVVEQARRVKHAALQPEPEQASKNRFGDFVRTRCDVGKLDIARFGPGIIQILGRTAYSRTLPIIEQHSRTS